MSNTTNRIAGLMVSLIAIGCAGTAFARAPTAAVGAVAGTADRAQRHHDAGRDLGRRAEQPAAPTPGPRNARRRPAA